MPSKTTLTRREGRDEASPAPTSWQLPERDVRPRRLIEHPGADATVYVPSQVWHHTLDLMRGYAPLNSERMVLWSGVVGAAGGLLVQTAIVPDHEPAGWRVDVDGDVWRAMLAALRRQDQMLVAQVHSHPGAAFHSWGDDAYPAEHADGFLSIVVPDFGQDVERIGECGVFEYRTDGQGGSFVELSDNDVAQRVMIEQEVVRAVPYEA